MNKLATRIIRIIKSNTIYNRFANAIIFGVGGTVGSRILMLLAGIFVSNVIGKSSYGQFSHVNSTIILFVTFSGLGLGSTLTRYVSINKNTDVLLAQIIGSLRKISYIISVIVSVIFFILSNSISIFLSGDSQLAILFQISSLAMLFASLSSIEVSILLGVEKYKQTSIIEIIKTALYLIISIILSKSFGLVGAVIALSLAYLLRFIFSYLVSASYFKKRKIKFIFIWNNDLWDIIKSFSIPVFIASIFAMPVTWINNSILARNSGFEEVALFSVAFQWLSLITFIPLQFNQVKPIYADLHANGQSKELVGMVVKMTLLAILIVIPIVVVTTLFSDTILALYGATYINGSTTFILMMIVSLIITCQSQIGYYLEAIGKMWLGFILNGIWAFNMIISFIFLKQLGSMGYAISYLISYFLHLLLSLLVIYRIIKKQKLLFKQEKVSKQV